MFSRREFLKRAAAVTASTVWPHASANARSSYGPPIKVFGIGGAGSNIVKKLSSQVSIRRSIITCTVNNADAPGVSDLKLATGIIEPLSIFDAGQISIWVSHADPVILVAGMGGKTGTRITRHFAQAAKEANARVFAVLVLPFAFEGKRVSLAREGTSAIARIADWVTLFDNESLLDHLSPEVTVADALAYADRQVIHAVANSLNETPQAS